MSRRSSEAVDYLRAIETLSETEEPARQAMRQAGPGGEAYDRAPTPSTREGGGTLANLAMQAKRMLSPMTKKLPETKDLVQKTSKQAERAQRRAVVFLKHNAILLTGVAVFAASMFAARKYWRR
jgi:hypothetical protein